MTLDELAPLRQASAGLLYPSESDRPFDVFRWEPEGVDYQDAMSALIDQVGSDRRIEDVPVDRFFADLEASEDAGRFAALRRVAESQLAGLAIFRVGSGEISVDIYLVGRLSSGRWAGLHTVSVET